ncbi:unnamed protein product [Angiostrongylus costaricensis]|uniref:Uncharacterized protein n=1 Tax=Angiostrongylus costaricensis TaxID=334426 RepID=A0A0R3PRZ0_ANGCS|nr:unnamed protein product [Angiostrongylus costaricensis]
MALAASPNPLQPLHSRAVEAGILEKSASLPIGVVLGLLLSIYMAFVYGDFIYRSYLTLNRDLSGLFLILDIKFDLWKKLRENRGLHDIFLEVVKKYVLIDNFNSAFHRHRSDFAYKQYSFQKSR